ncbi:MAG: hypothetical protein SFV55_05290 [Haliscomenobacter sp.]|uniref:hypothetical protein n=1 Tax=Haliscomenobacter sp. TaxID=2717303 RepID=UPI0029A28FAA|nr:hypothetical protein [Haliscomenobacter sp.]MDX2067818.1 hypothetical protein [Haliscomenobacter sp.]
MGMILCPIHGEHMIGFVSNKVSKIIHEGQLVDQELIRLTITDKDLDLSSAQLVLKEEYDQFMQKYKDGQLINSDELNLLSVPYCGACIKAFLEKKALMSGKQEIFLTIIE